MRFKAITLRTHSNGARVWVKALAETIEYFGWEDVFEPLDAPTVTIDGRVYAYDTGWKSRNPRTGGQKLRLSRAREKHSYARTMIHTIRVSQRVTNADLAELVHFAQQPIGWLETKKGRRLSQDDWEGYYLGVLNPFKAMSTAKVGRNALAAV